MAKLSVPREEAKKPSAGFTPDFVDKEADDFKGFEALTQEVMAIPFVRILQKLSPQLDKNKPEYIAGAEVGQFFNTLTKEVYGTSFNCVVLKFEHIYIEWRPNRGGFVGYHTPEHAEKIAVDQTFGAWKTESGNLLQESYTYVVLVEGHEHEGPMVLALSSSAIKMGRQWNKLMVTHVMENGERAKPYYLVWEIGTEYLRNDKGDWYAPTVRYVKYITKEQKALLTQERKMLPDRRIDYRQIEARVEEAGDPASY